MQVHLSETACKNCGYEDCRNSLHSQLTFLETGEGPAPGPCEFDRDAAAKAMSRLLDDLRSGKKKMVVREIRA